MARAGHRRSSAPRFKVELLSRCTKRCGQRGGPESHPVPFSRSGKPTDFSISFSLLRFQGKVEDKLSSSKHLSTYSMAGFKTEELAIVSPLHHIQLSSLPIFAPQLSVFTAFPPFSAVTVQSLFPPLPPPCSPNRVSPVIH